MKEADLRKDMLSFGSLASASETARPVLSRIFFSLSRSRNTERRSSASYLQGKEGEGGREGEEGTKHLSLVPMPFCCASKVSFFQVRLVGARPLSSLPPPNHLPPAKVSRHSHTHQRTLGPSPLEYTNEICFWMDGRGERGGRRRKGEKGRKGVDVF